MSALLKNIVLHSPDRCAVHLTAREREPLERKTWCPVGDPDSRYKKDQPHCARMAKCIAETSQPLARKMYVLSTRALVPDWENHTATRWLLLLLTEQILDDYSQCTHFCFTENGRKFFPTMGFRKQSIKFSVSLCCQCNCFPFLYQNWFGLCFGIRLYDNFIYPFLHIHSSVVLKTGLSSCVATTRGECWQTLSRAWQTFAVPSRCSFGTMTHP